MICGSEIVIEDLKSVDIAGMQMLDRFRKDLCIEKVRFVIKDISGEDVELIRYGRSVRVDSKKRNTVR